MLQIVVDKATAARLRQIALENQESMADVLMLASLLLEQALQKKQAESRAPTPTLSEPKAAKPDVVTPPSKVLLWMPVVSSS